METNSQTQNQHRIGFNMRRSQSSNSDSHPRAAESPHSPLRFHSPLRSDLGDPPETPPYGSPGTSPTASPEKPREYAKAVVGVDKCTQYSPYPSPLPSENRKQPDNVPPGKMPLPAVVLNRVVREEPPPAATKFVPGAGHDEGRSRQGVSVRRRTRSEEAMSKAALGFRISEVILCLISFSVMAADKTQGWSGDSFDRYREYRYCLSMNVIAFVYSGFQAFDLAYHLTTGKHFIGHHLRRYFDFFMDQILAYLLISAASAAATRVDDWQSNWGKDQFTKMASASIAMAFLAFVAFGISSLISGYNLCIDD